MKILVYAGYYQPGYEKRYFNIANELCNRGNDVIYALPTEELKGNNPPGYPLYFKEQSDFRTLGTCWIDKIQKMFNLIDQTDVAVFGENKGINHFVKYARKTGKYIIQHHDIGGQPVHIYDPDLLCISGEWYKPYVINHHSINENKICITGSVQFDAANPKRFNGISKKDFCKKYGLSPNKKIAVWLPSSPALHNSGYRKLYQKIIGVIKETKNIQVIIKGHPSDYSGHKRYVHYGKNNLPSWQILTPDVPVCKPEDTYECFYFSDVGISRFSSVAIEYSALFRKPIIFVNLQEFFLPSQISDIIKIPYKTPEKAALRKIEIHENVMKIAQLGVKMPTNLTRSDLNKFRHEYIGLDCQVEELKDILTEEKYVFTDDSVYDAYVKKYCYANDGQSYKRIADAIMEFIEKKHRKTRFYYKLNGFLYKNIYRMRENVHVQKGVNRLRRII